MNNNNPYLTHCVHETLSAIVRDPSIDHHKLSAFADEFEFTVDALNNRIYGRVAMDDHFIMTFFDWIYRNARAHARRFLRDYFKCSGIAFSDDQQQQPFQVEDLHKLLLKIAESVGATAGTHVVNLQNDGQLDMFETKKELELIRVAKTYIDQYESSLLHHQADLVSEQSIVETRSKKRAAHAR